MRRRILITPVLALAALLLAGGCASLDYGEDIFMGDKDLAIEVSQRLQEDGITERYRFGVSAQAGQVTLKGHIPDSSARHRAISIALGTPGVREVVDECSP